MPNTTPQLATLADGDGDLDAVVGNFCGTFRYFQNTGTATLDITLVNDPLQGMTQI